ncbi:hypothetical protein, partial [Rhodoplanes elegans]
PAAAGASDAAGSPVCPGARILALAARAADPDDAAAGAAELRLRRRGRRGEERRNRYDAHAGQQV